MHLVKWFKALLPYYAWAFLGFALLMRPAPGLLTISNILFNYFIVFVGIRIGVFIHETGHLLCAKLAGGKPRRMVIGKGNELYRTDFKGVKFVLHEKGQNGLAFATFSDSKNYKFKYGFFVSGGILANLLVAFLLTLLFKPQFTHLLDGHQIEVIGAFAAANGILFFINLLPFYVTYQGIKLPSDGMNLMKLPWRSKPEVQHLLMSNDLLDAWELTEDRQYQAAINLYEKCLQVIPHQPVIQINLTGIYCRLGEFTKALSILNDLESRLEEEVVKICDFLIFNNLAWTYLILNDLEKADHYSEKAYKLNPTIDYIIGTRGAVLIERNELEKGIPLLLSEANFDFVNSRTLTAAIFLMIAFHRKGELDARNRYRDFVLKNLELLESDDLTLFERKMFEVVAD